MSDRTITVRADSLPWYDLQVGDLVIAKYESLPKFSILILDILTAGSAFSGLLLGHESAAISNQVHTFHRTGKMFQDEDWSFALVPVSAKVAR